MTSGGPEQRIVLLRYFLPPYIEIARRSAVPTSSEGNGGDEEEERQ